LGVDLDERGLLGRVVLADLLDRAAVTLLARVHDDDAVVRGAHLAHALETDLDCHCGGYSWFMWGGPDAFPGGCRGRAQSWTRFRRVRGARRSEYSGSFCQTGGALPNPVSTPARGASVTSGSPSPRARQDQRNTRAATG